MRLLIQTAASFQGLPAAPGVPFPHLRWASSLTKLPSRSRRGDRDEQIFSSRNAVLHLKSDVSSGTPRLVVLNGARQGTEVGISAGQRVTIGSHRGTDLHLRDAAVSWDHARLWVERGEVLVEDLDSAGGTLVNGQLVTYSRLLHGDTITIGSTQMRFVTDDSDGAETPAEPSGPSLLDEIAELKEQLANAQREREALEKEVGALRDSRDDALKQAGNAEKQAKLGHKRRKEAATRVEILENELSELRASAVSAQGAVASAVASREAEAEARRREVDDLRQENESLDRQYRNYE